MITATQILNLLMKAQKLGISTSFIQNNNGYKVNLYYDWCGNNDYYYKEVFLNYRDAKDIADSFFTGVCPQVGLTSPPKAVTLVPNAIKFLAALTSLS